MKIVSVVGARPNFMKMASLAQAFSASGGIQNVLVHTGQHYDNAMSQVFFDELKLPKPDVHLDVGSGTHAMQTAAILTRFEPVLDAEKPDAVVVVGDVNSTMACALAAAKKHVPVAHVESGLRSFDRRMPEEINRVVADHLSQWLFTSEPSGAQNLKKEGIERGVHFVGNTMIDCLKMHQAAAKKRNAARQLDLDRYGLVTLHRPENVDAPAQLEKLVAMVETAAKRMPLVVPIHPRTKKQLEQYGHFKRLQDHANIRMVEPLGYLDFLSLQMHAAFVLTDSGGIQEETTFLNVPCLTLRSNTERPVTVLQGSNTLIGLERAALEKALDAIENRTYKQAATPEKWDGQAGKRIAKILGESAA